MEPPPPPLPLPTENVEPSQEFITLPVRAAPSSSSYLASLDDGISYHQLLRSAPSAQFVYKEDPEWVAMRRHLLGGETPRVTPVLKRPQSAPQSPDKVKSIKTSRQAKPNKPSPSSTSTYSFRSSTSSSTKGKTPTVVKKASTSVSTHTETSSVSTSVQQQSSASTSSSDQSESPPLRGKVTVPFILPTEDEMSLEDASAILNDQAFSAMHDHEGKRTTLEKHFEIFQMIRRAWADDPKLTFENVASRLQGQFPLTEKGTAYSLVSIRINFNRINSFASHLPLTLEFNSDVETLFNENPHNPLRPLVDPRPSVSAHEKRSHASTGKVYIFKKDFDALVKVASAKMENELGLKVEAPAELQPLPSPEDVYLVAASCAHWLLELINDKQELSSELARLNKILEQINGNTPDEQKHFSAYIITVALLSSSKFSALASIIYAGITGRISISARTDQHLKKAIAATDDDQETKRVYEILGDIVKNGNSIYMHKLLPNILLSKPAAYAVEAFLIIFVQSFAQNGNVRRGSWTEASKSPVFPLVARNRQLMKRLGAAILLQDSEFWSILYPHTPPLLKASPSAEPNLHSPLVASVLNSLIPDSYLLSSPPTVDDASRFAAQVVASHLIYPLRVLRWYSSSQYSATTVIEALGDPFGEEAVQTVTYALELNSFTTAGEIIAWVSELWCTLFVTIPKASHLEVHYSSPALTSSLDVAFISAGTLLLASILGVHVTRTSMVAAISAYVEENALYDKVDLRGDDGLQMTTFSQLSKYYSPLEDALPPPSAIKLSLVRDIELDESCALLNSLLISTRNLRFFTLTGLVAPYNIKSVGTIPDIIIGRTTYHLHPTLFKFIN